MGQNGEKSNIPNLDLIGMVQKARMLHDSTAQPSQIAAVYWIEAKPRADAAVKPPTPRTGQWVIETTVAVVDALWAAIKAATEAGELGYKSKVSTAPHAGKQSDQRMICVRTYDADDQADVERVRTTLERLGITGNLRYELDRE